ncbi:hypothetical protein PVAG01_01250 [Phlyctema vagabunda]|uniref:DUF8035 domain-containing protein n=1 Tax=Phlyctema vagabunda TaxID=108571 RepID=A0ABR4PWN0_9HELO
MSRDPYRSSAGDLGYGRGGGGRPAERWDAERFDFERDRARYGGPPPEVRDRIEEREIIRDTRGPPPPRGGGGFMSRPREHSFDEVYEGRGRGRFEDTRHRERTYYDDEPRYEREPIREREQKFTIEKEREYYSPSPPRRAAGNRPAFLRRQSSLDTFDRKPMVKYSERREEELYGPPARRDEFRPIPLPRTKALPPPRRYAERDYEDIKVAEPDFYGDDDFRGYPERVREREIIRTRRRSRSRSRERSTQRSTRGSTRGGSVRSSSISSSSSSGAETVRSEFPKKGKTRMPARLVSKKAIIDLGYPFEVEGDTIIIQKALGRENIDEVIKLSEDYKVEKVKEETLVTNYLVAPEQHHMHGGRSEAGTVVEEHKTEIYSTPPPPPPPGWMPAPPPPPPQPAEIITDTRITHDAHHHDHHHHDAPIIIDAGRPREETVFHERRETIERSDPMPVGPLALALPAERSRGSSERAIRAEIKALEAEKEALRAEKRADREMRKAERLRAHGRSSEGDLVLYEQDRVLRGDEVTLVRRERIVEPEGGAPVRIEKDKKGRMSISVPKYYR